MKTNEKKVRTVFGPETKFEITPVTGPPFWTFEIGLEQLKSKLLHEQLNHLVDAELNNHIRLAANEAEELALATCYPLLVFPELFQERVDKRLSGNCPGYAGQFTPNLLELQTT